MTVRARLFCALAMLVACSEPPGPEDSAFPGSAALVSSSITRQTGSNASTVGGNAYVSMVPGTDPDGQRVSVRALRTGSSASAPMVNGGFDPLAVQADPGDTLAVTVVYAAGDDSTTYSTVPVWSRPRIVRTSPAAGKTDVPLNSLILVVFNQPMDSASLSDALHLRQNGVDVPGTVSGEVSGGVILSGKLVPDAPLAPNSAYDLTVSTTARSPGGMSLDAPLRIDFRTTASPGLGGPAVTGKVISDKTSLPVAGAVVRIGDAAATTGSDGGYELDGIPPGPATIRCTAPPGFADFESDITVSSDLVWRDIVLTEIDVFELDDFALFVPAVAEVPRGVLLILGGSNTKSFATREPFGAATAETEVALQSLRFSLWAMAANQQFAILGTSLAGLANGPASDRLVLDALRAGEQASRRPGLSALPMMVYGMSEGAAQASGFSARQPDRVAGVFLKTPLGIGTATGGVPLKVPTFMVLAELDALVDNAAVTEAFEAGREASALWGLGVENNVSHQSLSPAQRLLTLTWMDNVLDVRLAASPSGPLRDLSESAGWLGNPATGDVSSWIDYPGDKASASWLPSQAAAERWQSFVDQQRPPGSPGAYPDVSGVWDLTATVTHNNWGILGWQFRAELTISHSTDQPHFGGTYGSASWGPPGGPSEPDSPGGISGTIGLGGQIVMELIDELNQGDKSFEGTLDNGRIEGTFQSSSETSGTFVAERR